MSEWTGGKTQRVKAALVCPDAALAQRFLETAARIPQIEIVSQLGEYPSASTAAARIGPGVDAAFVDVASDRRLALTLMSELARDEVATVALHGANDPEAILQCLRSGATEFLASPFAPADVTQAAQRILDRRAAESRAAPARRGRLWAFAPAKGGSGATTLAIASAFRLQRETGGRVLLADLNLSAGVIAFLLRLRCSYSALDALRHSSQLDEGLWKSIITSQNGVDVLTAPERPEPALIEPYPVHELLDFTRTLYDYVVVDLGGVCDGLGMTAVSGADSTNLVCSSEMTSLFMMRRTIPLLEEMGRSRDQINVLVNRFERRGDLSPEELERIFRATVHATFPEDAASVQRAQREGLPVIDNSDFGKSVRRFVQGLVGAPEETGPAANPLGALKHLLGGA